MIQEPETSKFLRHNLIYPFNEPGLWDPLDNQKTE
jgi:hypothetical protein